jgi:hypothetical protein
VQALKRLVGGPEPPTYSERRADTHEAFLAFAALSSAGMSCKGTTYQRLVRSKTLLIHGRSSFWSAPPLAFPKLLGLMSPEAAIRIPMG